ncbi:MAG: response regulator transcription factor [Bryobacteraceae bacterium]
MNDHGPKILLVDDEDSLRRVLRARLLLHGYSVYEANRGRQALSLVPLFVPDLIVLDLGLPDLDGIEVTRRIRKFSQTPVVILSVRRTESDKISVLEAGADDYLTKPCNLVDLLDRIRGALRGQSLLKSGVFTAGDLLVDFNSGLVQIDSHPVHLTAPEFDVLRALVANAGRLLTQRRLVREVWGENNEESSVKKLRSTITTLRRKLDANPARPGHIATEPGVGYRLRLPSAISLV